ncbi:unnamed protein product [Lactuca saligna]|uniref:Homeobox domain-containing protein n=1 Tax=Lactuca saligna TaxID=75948 RepID=A0AA35ZJG4_LACSI|nr:unnamed protein product [Lactuca saligna]
MELGLSLGDKSCKKFHAITTKIPVAAPTFPSAADNCSVGFCMALTINAIYGTNKTRANDDSNKKDDQTTFEDQEGLKESPRIKAIIDGREKALQLNPPLQLDLLPDRHAPSLPWSSDNGNSHGGSSENLLAATGFDVKSTPPATMGTEEATSSLRLDFYSSSRTANVLKNKSLELINDVVEMQRGPSRASDEDHNGIYRKKLRLTKQQSAYLEESFKDHSILNHRQKLDLAIQLNLSPRQVEVWFQNRRARTKLKQTEMDYEYLKNCCETLTRENRRLHKELKELRALKTISNPFNLQLPPTTLAMCSSCELVAATTYTITPAPPSTKFLNTPLSDDCSH